MKNIVVHLLFLLVVSCANGKEKTYIGSTPADAVVKSFLGIPLSDSIDFIRWKLLINDKQYHLYCNYGIGKPNTNGFINDGKKIELNGAVRKEKNFYELQNGNKILMLAELNGDLLHLLNAGKSLLVGNGGWSYTLNNIKASGTDQVNITAKQTILKDSMVFDGRTPCRGLDSRPECYKLKWRIILYANAKTNEPGTYKILGTSYRTEGGKNGSWKILLRKDGRKVYQLNDEKGNVLLRLLKLDDNILVFTDANEKLMVGDEDFSYTLNRKL
jgi:hypothetical protein